MASSSDFAKVTTRTDADQASARFLAEKHPWNIHAAIATYERTGEFTDEDGQLTKDHEWTAEEIDAMSQ